MTPTQPPCQIIPVLDIMGGRVVRAIGGRRGEYRPLTSPLTTSTDPEYVAVAMASATSSFTVYVADLDAIIFGRPSSTVQEMELGCISWIKDVGIRSVADAERLDQWTTAVVGTETVDGPGTVEELVRRRGPQGVVLSVDLNGSRLLGNWRAWGVPDDSAAGQLVDVACGLGVRAVIVLDLAHVGEGSGPGTEATIEGIHRRHPELGIAAGGGVRGWDDVRRLKEAGASAVLVSSAIHDGTIGHYPPA